MPTKQLNSRTDIEDEFDMHAGAIAQLEESQRALNIDFNKIKNLGRQALRDSDGNYKGVFDSEEQAEDFGLRLMAATHDDPAVRQRCFDRVSRSGFGTSRAMGGGIESDGSALVPIEFSSRVKRLIESHGVAIRNMFYMPMSSDQLTFVKQVGELTVFLLSEGSSGAESKMKVERVTLQAKEWGTLTMYPRTLDEDAAVIIGEMIARSVIFAFARKADQIVFNGDGSADYFGIQGIIPKLTQINGVDDGGGIVLGSGAAWDDLTLGDFQKVQGRLPEYEGETTPKWYCSRTFYFNVMVKLMLEAGGVTAEEIEGRRRKVFLGDEVEFVEVMPKTSASGQVPVLYGDMPRAATYGDRRRMQIEQSKDYKFAERQVTVLGLNRCAISIEDLGDADNAGPMVGLITQ